MTMLERLAKLRDREAAIFEGETYDEPNDAYSFKRGFDKCYSLMVDDLTAANAKLEKLKDALADVIRNSHDIIAKKRCSEALAEVEE